MLSLYEYITLEQSDRAELLWSNGIYINNSIEENCSFALYSLYNFYVEVVLIENEIAELIPFKQGQRLEKYLDSIDISELN